MRFETCLECGSKISKYGKKFCSSRCSGLYNNRNCEKLKNSKRGPLPRAKVKKYKNCVSCGNILVGRQRKFCNHKCQNIYYESKLLEDWFNGKHNGTSKSGLSRAIRKRLLIINNYSCSKCGWNKINKYTNSSPLEVHHVDGNAYNNRPENLEVLCPNCHSLSEYHHGSNKGNGRRELLKKYYIRGSNGKVI